jgi:hypothetical protein
MRRGRIAGAAVVVITTAALETFRLVWMEPRAIGLACVHHTGPAALCSARAGVGLLQHFGVWGGVALALGILALATGRFWLTVGAVCFGAAGLINYNISWGMLGAALGVWTWLRQPQTNQTPPLSRAAAAGRGFSTDGGIDHR